MRRPVLGTGVEGQGKGMSHIAEWGVWPDGSPQFHDGPNQGTCKECNPVVTKPKVGDHLYRGAGFLTEGKPVTVVSVSRSGTISVVPGHVKIDTINTEINGGKGT